MQLLIIRSRAVILTTNTLPSNHSPPARECPQIRISHLLHHLPPTLAKSVDYLQITGTDARILHCNVSA